MSCTGVTGLLSRFAPVEVQLHGQVSFVRQKLFLISNHLLLLDVHVIQRLCLCIKILLIILLHLLQLNTQSSILYVQISVLFSVR